MSIVTPAQVFEHPVFLFPLCSNCVIEGLQDSPPPPPPPPPTLHDPGRRGKRKLPLTGGKRKWEEEEEEKEEDGIFTTLALPSLSLPSFVPR